MTQKTFEEYVVGAKLKYSNGKEMLVEWYFEDGFRCKDNEFTYIEMPKAILLIHIDMSLNEELKENIRNLFPEEFV